MNDFSAWSVWGGGQLFAFSAFDGETDWRNGLVLRSVAAASVLEVKLPEAGGALLFDLAPPRRCLLAGDHFILETASGEVRGAFIDARHLLVEGNCRAVGLSGAVRVATRPGRLLLGARESFDETLLKVDFGAVLASRAAFLAHLPLVQTESETARRALLKACSQLKIQLNSPAGLLRHRWTTPDRWPHRWMWLWDSVFHAAGLRHLDPVAARESLEAVFDVQQEDGFIPHFASPESRSEITQPPLLGFGMELVAGEDDAFLAGLYPKNAAFLEWIFANRDSDGAGLVEWAIEAEEQCRSGESGMDNSPRFDGAVQLDAPDFNAYLAHDCDVMARIAERLKRPGEAALWRGRRDRLNRLMNEFLWDDEAGLYVDFDVVAKRRTGVLSSAGFLPLLSGAPSPRMAARMVSALGDPELFGSAFPVPSIARNQERFYAKDMWRGPVWVNINYLIARGLRRYGFDSEADLLLSATCGELEREFLRYGTFFEFYDDRRECTPPELLRKGCCAPERSPYHQVFMDYGWSASLYVDMVFSAAKRHV